MCEDDDACTLYLFYRAYSLDELYEAHPNPDPDGINIPSNPRISPMAYSYIMGDVAKRKS